MANGTLVIYARPDPGKDPEVHLSERDVSAAGSGKIKWKKDSSGPDFDFVGFVPIKNVEDDFVNPFKKIKVNKNRIRCDFVGGVDGPDYKYTVAIEYNGKALNTDVKDPPGPSHGRAVIRN